MASTQSRSFWHRLEAVNALAYFSRECRDGLKDAGLQGFWMGYFASRAAPMGAVTPGVVEATFYNFHPDMVRRALPDAWDLVAPESVLVVRMEGAAAALRRLVPEADAVVPRLVPMLQKAIAHGIRAGRPLFAANRDLVTSDDLGGLWQAATALREHRGDGHTAILTEADLDGCQAHVLVAATGGGPPGMLKDNRGWSNEDWERAADGLRDRGLLTGAGQATVAGRRLRRVIEERTDELASQPYLALSGEEAGEALRLLASIGRRIVESGEIPFPNPIGLPAPRDR